jgi:hypothetical protein
VLVPAYLALKQKGFNVHWVRSSVDPEHETWYAEDDTREFIADDPVALLGLVAMYEVRGDDWKASDKEISDFLAQY